MKPTSAADLAEFEALAGLATSAVNTSGLARWERKKAALKTNNGTPSKRARENDSASPAKMDRFIPNRPGTEKAAGANLFGSENNCGDSSNYQKMLETGLLGGSSSNDYRVLSFRDKAPVAQEVRQVQFYIFQNAMTPPHYTLLPCFCRPWADLGTP
jgi:hypothetical protein